MLPNIDLKVFESLDKLGQGLKDSFSGAAVSYIIPGGTTSQVIVEALRASKANLGQSNIFLTDDRIVPHQSESSNFGQIQRLVSNDEVKIFSWTTADGLLIDTQEIQRHKEKMESAPRELILGVGGDGHFASLFPTDAEFADGLFQKVIRRKEDQYMRFSLSMSFLLKSDTIKVVFYGQGKRQVFNYIKEDDKSIPIVRFINECNNISKPVTIYTTQETYSNND